MTRVPAGAADLVAASGNDDAFGDRFPTQPIAVGRCQAGLVLDHRRRAPDATGRRMPSAHRQPPPSRHHHAASTGGVSHRRPARTAARPTRSAILIAVAVVIAAVTGALGYQTWAASSPTATSDASAPSVPAPSPETVARQDGDVPRPPLPPRSDGRHGDHKSALGEADGAVPHGVTVSDDDIPAVANLDPALLEALRQAATDAADDRVEFVVNNGWRSREYQEQLLDEVHALPYPDTYFDFLIT
jgi:hypothetical protein